MRLLGDGLIAFFSARKNNANSKYYYVQGVVESCELKADFSGTNYVHSITYSLKDQEYVWEYVDNVAKFYKGEKVNLKVHKEKLTDVELDQRTDSEKKAENKFMNIIPIIIGVVFVIAGGFGVIVTLKRKNVLPINVSFGR